MVRGSRHRQFDVFRNPDAETSGTHPYLIVLQSDAIFDIDSCVVAPLISARTIKLFERLLPRVFVDGTQYVVAIPDMAAIPTGEIGAPVANLETDRDKLLAAIDLIFTGI